MTNKAESFWDKRASNFAKKRIKDEQAFQNTIQKVKSYLSEADRVLDYACGTGTVSNLIAESVKEIDAIDVSSKMLAFAREKAAALKIDNIQHSKITLFDGRLDDARFDAVLAFNILHLSENMQEVIQRTSQLLKPGGLLISSTPCLNRRFSLMGIVELFLAKLGIVPNLKMPTVAELETTVQNANFELISVEKPDPKSVNCFLVARKL
jgi:2-polyprenyl-3-methyl-5-hydroxy-6-metoxy-1,4-benzoquinol methylase